MHNNINNILVIEDEENVREFLKAFLEENNFNVTVAPDGLKGMELVEEKLPGIIIVDLLLPGEHGIDLVKSIRQKYFVPIIIMSSIYDHDEIDDFMEEYCVEGFFAKPLDLDKLLEKINSIINVNAV